MSRRPIREELDGKIRCGSNLHEGDRMRPVSEFCKSKTPDGLSYSCKSCRRKENAKHNRARYERWKNKNPISALLAGRRGDAKKRGLEFTLTEKDIIIPEKCPVLGIPIIAEVGPRTDNSPSLDRIDNTKGYTPDNIVVVSWRANLLKKDATLTELKLLAEFYIKIEEKK